MQVGDKGLDNPMWKDYLSRRNPPNIYDALDKAVTDKNWKLCQYLLKRGADIRRYAESGQYDICSKLLRLGRHPHSHPQKKVNDN